MTERARYRFRVCESESNKFWLMAEPVTSDIKMLKHGMLGFDMHPETTQAQAQQIADFLNKNLAALTYNGLGN